MQMKIKIDTKEAQNALAKGFWGLSKGELNKGFARAMNDAIKQGRTIVKRSVTAEYNIKSNHVANKLLPIERANPNKLEATLSMSVKPIPVGEFKGAKQNEEGVSVSIRKGERSLVRGAFMTESTGAAVLGRNEDAGSKAYAGGRFRYRNKRKKKTGLDMPIATFLTVSPYRAGLKMIDQDAVQASISDAYARRGAYHLTKLLSK